jgi:acyl carrier protein
LDTLAHRRRARGERALSVNWGVLLDSGVVARNRDVEAHLDRLGIRGFRATAALECLSRLLTDGPAQAGAFDIDWAQWAETSSGARVPRFSNFVDARGRGIHPLAAELAVLTPEERSRFVETAICAQLARVVRTTADKIDMDLSLENMGVDSLMSVELVTGLREALSVDLPPMLLMQGRSIRALAKQIIGMILPDPPSVDDRIEEMTEAELDALLAGAR